MLTDEERKLSHEQIDIGDIKSVSFKLARAALRLDSGLAARLRACEEHVLDWKRGSAELAAWKDTAEQQMRNVEYYRGLVVQIGEMLGESAYIADDGGKHDSVLSAKVPELVKQQLSAARADGERLRAMLKRLEWNHYILGDIGCPACSALARWEKHSHDCELAALLRPQKEQAHEA